MMPLLSAPLEGEKKPDNAGCPVFLLGSGDLDPEERVLEIVGVMHAPAISGFCGCAVAVGVA